MSGRIAGRHINRQNAVDGFDFPASGSRYGSSSHLERPESVHESGVPRSRLRSGPQRFGLQSRRSDYSAERVSRLAGNQSRRQGTPESQVVRATRIRRAALLRNDQVEAAVPPHPSRRRPLARQRFGRRSFQFVATVAASRRVAALALVETGALALRSEEEESVEIG